MIKIGLTSYVSYMLSADFPGRVNALLFPMLCISTGKTGEGRTITKKNLNSDYLKSSNYFLRLQSDCFGAPRKYVVPCLVTDNGNGDSETAILQFPHRHGYSLYLHMLDCCVHWFQTLFAQVFWGRNDKIAEKERHKSLTSSYVSNLAMWSYVIQLCHCYAMSFRNSEIWQILNFVNALLGQNKNICFMLCAWVVV